LLYAEDQEFKQTVQPLTGKPIVGGRDEQTEV